MKRAFVAGHPISHSRSPLIHRHWLEVYGIEGSYEAIDVPPDDMAGLLDRVRSGEFVGGNITVPLKEIAFALCDERDEARAHIGAFNTLTAVDTPDGRKVRGTNTDHDGFLANLDAVAPGWDDGAERAIVLGAGGAARGILNALAARAIPAIHILNRTVDKANALADELPGPLYGGSLEEFGALAWEADLVVNTTTIGMHGTRFDHLALDHLPKTALVADIVYTPLETPLLAASRLLSLQTVDGLGMLLHQAVPGFESWFGIRPEVTPELRRIIEATL